MTVLPLSMPATTLRGTLFACAAICAGDPIAAPASATFVQLDPGQAVPAGQPTKRLDGREAIQPQQPPAGPARPGEVVGPNRAALTPALAEVFSFRSNDSVQPVLPSDEALRARAVPAATAKLVDDLGAGDYAARRAASEALQSASIPLQDLLAALVQRSADGTLSPEQHHRLLSIAFDRIVNAPRGALGIQFMKGGGGVRVTDIIAGFPAEKHLAVGDVIVAIDGLAVRETEDLLALVQGHPPGTEVRVEAIRAERDGKDKPKLDATGQQITRRIDVRVALGSKRALDNAGPPRMRAAGDPIDIARQEVGLQLLRRFPPPVVHVRLPDDARVEADFAARDVNRHDVVDELAREVEDARNQQRALDPETTLRFQAKLRLIKDLAAEPSCSEGERSWYRRVAERLEELLAAGQSKPQ